MVSTTQYITTPSQNPAGITIPKSLRPPPRVRQVTQPIPQQVIQPQPGITPPVDQPVTDKSWAGLKVMFERGKVKRGFGTRAIQMYEGATSPTSSNLDFMLQQGRISRSEHKALQQIRHNYRSALAEGRSIKIKTATYYDVPSTQQLPIQQDLFAQAQQLSEQIPFGGAILLKESEREIAEDIGRPRISPRRRTAVLPSGEVFISQPILSTEPGTFLGRVEERFHELTPGGQELPYRLGRTPERVSGEEFSPRYVHMYLSKRVVESESGQKIISEIERRFPRIKKAYGVTPYIAPFVEELPTFAFFSPFMRTGATAQQIQKGLSKTRFEKLGKFFNKVKKDLVQKKDWKAQTKYLSQLSKNLKGKELENFKEFVRLLYEQGFYKGVPIDVLLGQTPSSVTASEIEIIYQLLGQAPIMKDVGTIGAGISSLRLDEFRETKFVEGDALTTNPLFDFGARPQIKTKQKLGFLQLGYTPDVFLDEQQLQQKTKQQLVQKQPSQFLQKLTETQPSQFMQILSTAPAQAQPTKTKQVPRQRTPQSPIFRSPIRPDEKGGIPIIPFLRFKRDEFRKENRTQYDVHFLKHSTKPRERKWVRLNTKPQSYSSAMDKGSKYVDENISARFKVTAQKKTIVTKGKSKKVLKNFPTKKKLPKGSGYYGMNAFKFRPYKIQQKKQIPMRGEHIERQNYRLDSKKEQVQIQRAKRVSSFIFGGGFNSQPKRNTGKKKKRFRL